MTVEILLARAPSAQAIARVMARRVHETCPPTLPGAEVDRVEVLIGQAAVEADGDGAGPCARYSIPAQVSLVTQDALEAAPNGIPAATRLPVTAAMSVRAGIERAIPQPPKTPYNVASIQVGAVEAAGLPPGTLGAGFGPTSSPLDALWSGLGLPAPTQATSDVVDGSVVLRWDPVGGPVDRLAGTSFGAGLFLSGNNVIAMLRAKLGDALVELPDFVDVEMTWDPHGTVPHIKIRAVVAVAVVHIDVDLELVLGWTVPVLRARALWSTEIRTGPFFPILDEVAEAALESAVADALDPSSFGATPAGDHRFTLDTPLPSFDLAGIAVFVTALVASPEGMLFGARLAPPVDLPGPVLVSSSPLGGPTRVQLCSVNARTGSGARNTAPLTEATAMSFGHATIADYGHWCGFSVEPETFRLFVDVQVVTQGQQMELWARLPYSEVRNLPSTLRIVVRSTGGIRMIDLGRPLEITTDENGVITSGVLDLYIDDCLRMPEKFRRGIDWGSIIGGVDKPRWNIDDFRPVPLEWPAWIDMVAGIGLSSQLVTLVDLEPGELVRFRSRTHAVDVTADSAGRAYVPVLAPLGETMAAARLERAGRRPLDQHVRARTTAFIVGEPTVDEVGEPRLNPVGGGRRVMSAELNPQPLPPGGDRVAEELGLDDVIDVLPVPGFPSAPVCIVVLGDGQQLLVTWTADRRLRLAGTFSGPVGRIDVSGAGFEVRDGDRIARLVEVDGDVRFPHRSGGPMLEHSETRPS